MGPTATAFIEKVGPMPKQGVTSMFRFGVSFGAIQGIVAAMGIPDDAWCRRSSGRRFHRCGPSPDAARQRAVQLYPSVAPLLARKMRRQPGGCAAHRDVGDGGAEPREAGGIDRQGH